MPTWEIATAWKRDIHAAPGFLVIIANIDDSESVIFQMLGFVINNVGVLSSRTIQIPSPEVV
jgi:hypothetical protein